MTEIILKEDIGQKKLNALLDFIKSLNVDAEVLKEGRIQTTKGLLFESTRGIWKDHKIDAEVLRFKAWSKAK